MKKILLLLLLFIGFISCNESIETYTLKYVVFYPTGIDTVTISNIYGYDWYSQGGVHYIKELNNNYIYSGNSPYKILSYSREQK